MFTGIITHTGKIKKKTKETLFIEAPEDLYKKLTPGMSVAVNGICLTVTALKAPLLFSINFMPETAKKTNIQYIIEGDLLNLELPVSIDTLFAGHIVQGHVDDVSKILNIEDKRNTGFFLFIIKPKISKYRVEKDIKRNIKIQELRSFPMLRI